MFIVNKMTAGWRHWKDLPEEFKQYCVAEFKAKWIIVIISILISIIHQHAFNKFRLEAEKLDFVTGDKNELANLALQALSLTSQNAWVFFLDKHELLYRFSNFFALNSLKGLTILKTCKYLMIYLKHFLFCSLKQLNVKFKIIQAWQKWKVVQRFMQNLR